MHYTERALGPPTPRSDVFLPLRRGTDPLTLATLELLRALEWGGLKTPEEEESAVKELFVSKTSPEGRERDFSPRSAAPGC